MIIPCTRYLSLHYDGEEKEDGYLVPRRGKAPPHLWRQRELCLLQACPAIATPIPHYRPTKFE